MTYRHLLTIISLLSLCLVSSHITAASTATISAARLTTNNKQTQLVFVLNQPVKYTYFTLTNPTRVILDIRNATLATDLSKLKLTNTPIKAIRVGKQSQTIRLVLDAKIPINARAYLLEPELHYRDRLVLLLTPKTTPTTTKKTVTPATKPIADVPLKKAFTRDIIVVIDPGHGGKDPGAIGSKGTREKNVVLSISKELYQLMRREPGLTPVLTRSGDYFIRLRTRLQKARAAKADMFVAIHADAYRNRVARGASVYALSQRGASSEAARWLAQKENHSELGGVDLNGLESNDKTLRSVLIDLSQTATIAESLNIGSTVLKKLGLLNSLHHNKVEQARFVVLKSPDIPSILIETGFISNPSEERNLRSSTYRKRIARAILAGIKQYFTQHPPRGTYYATKKQQQLAQRHQEMTYHVAKGDTLSAIAEQYHVSVNAIRTRNQLSNHTIRVGQVLILPAVS